MKETNLSNISIPPIRILMLEDDPNDAVMVKNEIKKLNMAHEVRLATNGAEYMKYILEFDPDIILADYNLPEYDGLKALKIACTAFPDVPFIFVTGALQNEDVNELDVLPEVTGFVIKSNLPKLRELLLKTLIEVTLKDRKRGRITKSKEELDTMTETLLGFFTAMDGQTNSAYAHLIGEFNEQLIKKYS